MAYYIGTNTVVGVGINADNGGSTYGGAPAGFDYFRIKPGGFKYEPKNAKNVVEELDVDPTMVCVGGLYYTWSLECVMSYSYREQLLQLIAGGSISDAGAGPYEHTVALADQLLFGGIEVYYTDQTETWVKEVFENCAVTAVGFSQDAEGALQLSVSGIATGMSRSASSFAGSIADTEPICWRDFGQTGTVSTADFSLDGVTDRRIASLSCDVGASISEGDFDMAASTPAALSFLGRSGARDIKWGFDIRMDADSYTLIDATDTVWDGDNIFAWNNGQAAAAERAFVLTFGDSYVDGASRTLGAWGRETRSISLIAKDGTTGIIDFYFVNGRSTIPAP